MSNYKVVRDKMIKHAGVLVDAQADGTVHIQVLGGGPAIDLTEEQVGIVYQLLMDVTEYVHMTDGQLEKLAQRAEDEEDAS